MTLFQCKWRLSFNSLRLLLCGLAVPILVDFAAKKLWALQLGCGIWCYAETHLTMASQKMMAAALAHGGWQQNRQVRSHFGAPVQYRSNSVEAGTWSGVGILSDYPSREIHLALENGERSSCRLLVTRHLVHYMPILVAGLLRGSLLDLPGQTASN